MRFLWICLGGAAGTGARYLLGVWIAGHLASGFPWGTLAVNAIGSFLLGALVRAGSAGGLVHPTLGLVLATGVLGGFTTYSAFNQQTLDYLRGGQAALGVVYVLATVLLCLAAGMVGDALAGRMWSSG